MCWLAEAQGRFYLTEKVPNIDTSTFEGLALQDAVPGLPGYVVA